MSYLGLLLGAASLALSIWDTSIEKIERRLTGWKRMYLSKGGWLILIKSTLSNLPTYFLSLFPIPACVVAWIEKLYRDFLWSGIGDEFKFHLVSWDKVCRPIPYGGLGIKNLRTFNWALLGKWLWRYNMKPEALWKLVVDCKHGSLWGVWSTSEGNGTYGVGVWKHIRQGWGVFSHQTRLVVGKGTHIKFWRDILCGEEALKDSFPSVFRVACNQEASMADFMVCSRNQIQWNVTFSRAAQNWELDSFETFFSLVYPVRLTGLRADKLWWTPVGKGTFLVRSFLQGPYSST
ncbi:hypothetical protein I3842_04G177000 [Carya illinoinensis]|uniref:Uncharacterized protein n=1 Tax=Carya illinoinensis TaxID=32201 RepID=A0A922JVR3_CARIL|nr:hypothetical protein I3842_04G177000 [Carya illinoinensis]